MCVCESVCICCVCVHGLSHVSLEILEKLEEKGEQDGGWGTLGKEAEENGWNGMRMETNKKLKKKLFIVWMCHTLSTDVNCVAFMSKLKLCPSKGVCQ